MKRLSFLLLLAVLTGCAHMSRQDWHEVWFGPRAATWQQVGQQSVR